jgi:hypothetical protein
MATDDPIRVGGMGECCVTAIYSAKPGRENDMITCTAHDGMGEPVLRYRNGAWERLTERLENGGTLRRGPARG